MTLYDSLASIQPTLNSIPGKLGANKWSLTIRTEISTQSKQDLFTGSSEPNITTSDLIVLEQGQNPNFDFHGQNPNLDKPARGFEAQELAIVEEGYVRVGPISPKSINGGYTPEELNGGTGAHAVHYIVNGPGYNNVHFEKQLLNVRDPLAYYLTLRRT